MRFNTLFIIFFITIGLLSAQSGWQQTSGPVGGYVSALAYANNGNLVAGTYGSVFYSEDNGDTWNHSTDNPQDVNDIAVAADGTMYAANWYLWKSEDNGVSWNLLSSEKSFQHVFVTSNNTILGGTNSEGIFKSTDGGVNWTEVNHGLSNPTNARVMAFAESADHSTIYVSVANQGIYKSTDGGDNWTSIATYNDVHSLFVTSTDTLYVGNFSDGIYCTGDHGDSWISRKYGGDVSFARAFTEDNDGTVWYASDLKAGMYRWAGDQWQYVKPEQLKTSVTCFLKRADGMLLTGTSGQGVGLYDVGLSDFNFRANQFINTSITDLVVMNGHSLLAGTERSGLFRSDDNGDSWYPIRIDDYPANTVKDVKWDNQEKRIYVCLQSKGIWYQEPSQSSAWVELNDGIVGVNIDEIAIDTLNHIKYAGALDGEGIFRLSPGQTTWENIDNGLLFSSTEDVSTIFLGRGDSLFIGTYNNYDRPGLFLSTNHGDSWESFTNGLVDKCYIADMAQLPDGTLYAAVENYYDYYKRAVYKYDRGQQKWIIAGETGAYLSDLEVSRQGRLYVAGSWDVTVLNPLTGEFERAYETSLNKRITALAIKDDDQHLYFGVRNEGVFVTEKTVEYENNVTFSVNMNVQINHGTFDPVNDQILVGGEEVMDDADQDGVFEQTVNIEGLPGDTLLYKYMIKKMDGTEVWENVPKRMVVLTGSPITVPEVYFNNNDGSNPFFMQESGQLTANAGTSNGVVWIEAETGAQPDAFILNAGEINKYYHNDPGGFSEYAAGDLQNGTAPSFSATVGDYDNDGFTDIAVANGLNDVNHLYHNTGNRQFDFGNQGQIALGYYDSRGASWVDYNNDGWLDLFITNAGNNDNSLFRNNGDGSFEKIVTAPISSGMPFNSYGCAWADFDNDGDMDVYVVNGINQTNNYLDNNGDGSFTSILNGPHIQSLADDRGCSVADVDNDGDFDLFVTSYDERNKMYINDGSGSFIEISGKPPVQKITHSIGSVFGDFNNDGWIDLYVTNDGPNQLFLNHGNLTFEEVTFGPGVREDQPSGGVAAADYNNDGKLDLLIVNDGKNMLLKNVNSGTNHYLKILLNGTESNASAIGATIRVQTTVSGNPVWQTRYLSGQTGYMGQSSLTAFFGLGHAALVDTIKVFWPGADPEVYSSIDADQTIILTQTPIEAPLVTTDSAAVAADKSVTLYGTVDPGGAETACSFEYGTSTSYGSEQSATPSTVNGHDTLKVKLVLGPINPGVYHYRIKASNEKGTSYGEDKIFEIPDNIPDLGIDNPQNVSVRSAVLTGTVNPKGVATQVFFEVSGYGTNLQYDAAPSSVNGTSPVFVTVEAGGLTPGTVYTYNVLAVNQNGSWRSDTRNFRTADYPETIQLTADVDFPDVGNPSEFESKDYRLFGVPGNDTLWIANIISGAPNTDWVCYWDNGNPTDNYFVPYAEGDDAFRLMPGRGFWVLSMNTLSVNTYVGSVPLNDNSTFSLPLHDGWNIISNPFSEAVEWADVVTANGGTLPPIFAFVQGAFTKATKFLPYRGYYFFNNDNRNEIDIPYVSSSTALNKTNNGYNWKVDIQLSADGISEKCVSFGTADKALSGCDAMDYNKPRAWNDLPGVSFFRPQWNERYPYFASDIRPAGNDEKQSWEFTVSGKMGARLQLTFDGVADIPEALSVYLLDSAHGRVTDLRAENCYSFVAPATQSKLQILVGDKKDIQSDIDAVVPQAFQLGHNYPNPFNPQTAIPLALPRQADVRLEVFNLLGKHIQTLYNGSLDTGRHVFIWDGRNTQGALAPSGVYFYQVTLDNHKRYTRKMILMK